MAQPPNKNALRIRSVRDPMITSILYSNSGAVCNCKPAAHTLQGEPEILIAGLFVPMRQASDQVSNTLDERDFDGRLGRDALSLCC